MKRAAVDETKNRRGTVFKTYRLHSLWTMAVGIKTGKRWSETKCIYICYMRYPRKSKTKTAVCKHPAHRRHFEWSALLSFGAMQAFAANPVAQQRTNRTNTEGNASRLSQSLEEAWPRHPSVQRAIRKHPPMAMAKTKG